MTPIIKWQIEDHKEYGQVELKFKFKFSMETYYDMGPTELSNIRNYEDPVCKTLVRIAQILRREGYKLDDE